MKAIQTKPMLYAHYLNLLQEKAREMGYNLVLHGSLNRDCDLIAIPWVDEPKPHLELIQQLDFILTGRDEDYGDQLEQRYYMYSVLPGGRHSYVINLNRRTPDGAVDHLFYLDISVTPIAAQLQSAI